MAERVDDELLVERFQRGDESAFDSILERYSANIAVLANRLLGWPGDVDDITQDIFLAAFLGLKKFRCECTLKTWLFTITINKCRTHRYKRLLRLRRFTKDPGLASAASRHSADQTTMDRETSDRIRRAVGTLPAKYREPVVLRYLQELPMDEIARILGINKNALHVRLNRAKKFLKKDLAELIEENL